MLALLGVIAFLTAVHAALVFPMHTLPSPVYGGDYYLQLGATHHVMAGGNPLDSPVLPDTPPHYLVAYSFLAGNLARLLGVEAIRASFVFSAILVALSAAIAFQLGWAVFGNLRSAAFAALFFVSPLGMPVLKCGEMAQLVTIPLLLLALYHFLARASWGTAVTLGLAWGLNGLTHAIAFLVACGLLALAALVRGVARVPDGGRAVARELGCFAIAFAVGLPLVLLYWFDPIFVYRGHAAPHYLAWTQPIIGSEYLWSTLRRLLLDGSSVGAALGSLFTGLGLVSLVWARHTPRSAFLRFLVAAALLLTFHYLISDPLFGANLIADRIEHLILAPTAALVFVAGTDWACSRTRRLPGAAILVPGLVLAGLLGAQLEWFQARRAERFHASALQDLPEPLPELRRHVIQHTRPGDVFLTTKQIGFALNALTGRKLLVAGRTSNAFVDMDRRELDAAIILYGNDTARKLELLRHYGVDYLLWQASWPESEFLVRGSRVHEFDPLFVFESAEHRRELARYGIESYAKHTWVDPALRGDEYPKFDLRVVSPRNYRSPERPWQPDLDPYLRPVWFATAAGHTVARLFRVELEAGTPSGTGPEVRPGGRGLPTASAW